MSLLSQLLLELNARFFSEITTAMNLLERKIWMLANVAKNGLELEASLTRLADPSNSVGQLRFN